MRTKRVLVEAIQRVGLEQPARRLWDQMRASGLLPWAPLVPEGEFSNCAANALATLRRHVPDHAIGHYLEFGVSRGTSIACMYKVLQQAGLPHVHLVGFDSFEGLPPEAAKERWSPGSFKSTEAATRRYLTRAGVGWDRVTLVRGWFRDTLNAQTAEGIRLSKASLIMIDCDIYSGSREALWFCAPYITDHSVLFLTTGGPKTRERPKHSANSSKS